MSTPSELRKIMMISIDRTLYDDAFPLRDINRHSHRLHRSSLGNVRLRKDMARILIDLVLIIASEVYMRDKW